jgi:hypothetical protein
MYAVILEAAAFLVPGLIAGSKKIIKGNERYLVAIAAYFILSRIAKVAAEQGVSGGIQDVGNPSAYQNPNALATEYYQAFHPYVNIAPWLPDGTDEEALFILAARTYNYLEVFNAYRQKYSRNLTNDLQDELGTDYARFLSILNRK